jgi:hypothetical protein
VGIIIKQKTKAVQPVQIIQPEPLIKPKLIDLVLPNKTPADRLVQLTAIYDFGVTITYTADWLALNTNEYGVNVGVVLPGLEGLSGKKIERVWLAQGWFRTAGINQNAVIFEQNILPFIDGRLVPAGNGSEPIPLGGLAYDGNATMWAHTVVKVSRIFPIAAGNTTDYTVRWAVTFEYLNV